MSDDRFKDYQRRHGGRGFTAHLKTYGPFKANDGLIFGVCKGLADYYGWSVGLVRLIVVLASIFLFFWPTVIIYLVAALLMSPAPTEKLGTQEERDIWLKTQMDPDAAMEQLARRAGGVEKRLRRLEDYVTSREFAWQRKMRG